MAKKKKEIEIIVNLKGELLKLSMDYRKTQDNIKELEEYLKIKKEEIIEKAKKLNISKAKSQLLNFSYKKAKQTRLSTKKLKEILIAKKLEKIIKECEYDIEYDDLRITRRKGGENIF